VAEASCKLGHGRGFGAKSSGGGESAECSSDVAVAQGKRRGQGSAIPGGGGSRGGAQQRPRPGGAVWWQSEPDVGRVAHGIPARVDRLHGLGNAIVPQIAEILGWAIRETFEKGGLP
jgi:DNA (cytosine-5)-methyltransferase 1